MTLANLASGTVWTGEKLLPPQPE